MFATIHATKPFGAMDDVDARENYRGINLKLTGLHMCAVGIPNREYLDDQPNGLRIESVPLDYENCWRLPVEPMPANSFAGCLYFTDEANSSVTFVATEVTFAWVTEARRIY